MRGVLRRKGFPEVQAVTNHVISAMRKARGAPLPLEKAALCVMLDVIGRVGFQKDFEATTGFEAAIEGKAPPPSGMHPLAQFVSILRRSYAPSHALTSQPLSLAYLLGHLAVSDSPCAPRCLLCELSSSDSTCPCACRSRQRLLGGAGMGLDQ